MKPLYPYYLANKPVTAESTMPVVDKYTGNEATRVSLAGRAGKDDAVGGGNGRSQVVKRRRSRSIQLGDAGWPVGGDAESEGAARFLYVTSAFAFTHSGCHYIPIESHRPAEPAGAT